LSEVLRKHAGNGHGIMMDVDRFKKLPLMGIVRGVSMEDVEPLLETSIGAGLETIEVTMNTPGAPEMLSRMREISAGRAMVGAGTVLSKSDLGTALDAGAGFIVTPVFDGNIVRSCIEKDIPVFPGALTPREVFMAHEAGATMVKVFPSSAFGPGYIKALKGPFDGVRLMAVGGVNLENVDEYFSSGADAIAFGAGVFKKEWIEAKDFASIGRLVGEYVKAVSKYAHIFMER
ncbi:MAG: bifunctional 4-hydroxy-2-oxoglutarate aldolase/2-dehydro-3-deoxy-phosphogluconate aldolase, partial [Candidatus Omnitrophota bacterium]